jgi:hypothetical protein
MSICTLALGITLAGTAALALGIALSPQDAVDPGASSLQASAGQQVTQIPSTLVPVVDRHATALRCIALGQFVNTAQRHLS